MADAKPIEVAVAKRDRAYRLLRAFYAKRSPKPVVLRAERLYHRLACDAFVAKHSRNRSAS